MRALLSLIETIVKRIKPNLVLFVLLLYFLAQEIMGHIIRYISDPSANQLIIGALLNQGQGGMRICRVW